MYKDTVRTVKRVSACCKGGSNAEENTFVYEGQGGGTIVVSHPLNRIPYVSVLEVLGENDKFIIEPTIQIQSQEPFDVTINIEPGVTDYMVVLN